MLRERLVGLRHVLGIALMGGTLTTSDALRLGLVNRVVPAEHLMRASFDRDLNTQLIAETAAFAGCAAAQDIRSGMDAFFAKKLAAFEER